MAQMNSIEVFKKKYSKIQKSIDEDYVKVISTKGSESAKLSFNSNGITQSNFATIKKFIKNVFLSNLNFHIPIFHIPSQQQFNKATFHVLW